MMELQGDTAALNKYLKEQYGGMTNEEIAKKMMGDAKIDFESKEFKAALEKTQKMQGISDDPLYKKIMAEGRTLTKEEATYFNENMELILNTTEWKHIMILLVYMLN